MPEYLRYSLSFPDGVHVSSGGFAEESAEEFIRSDTLFSALCSTSSLLFGDAGPRTLLGDPDFVLSSAFPRIGEECFFPLLADISPDRFDVQDEVSSNTRKRLRNVEWIGEELLNSILVGKEKTLYRTQIQGLLSSHEKILDRWATRVEVPRVSVDRVSSAGQLFHFSELRFHPKAGLHFLVRPGCDETMRVFEAALHLLSDEGIGADRSQGKGWFRYSKLERDFDTPPGEKPRRLLLSLYQPTMEERKAIDFQNSRYALVTRRGWVTSPLGATLRRASARAFAEGSVLALHTPHTLRGTTPILLPRGSGPGLAHDVFRSFRCLDIGYCLPSTKD